MEAADSSETLVPISETVQRQTPEDGNIDVHVRSYSRQVCDKVASVHCALTTTVTVTK
jgi:hypothetical protein